MKIYNIAIVILFLAVTRANCQQATSEIKIVKDYKQITTINQMLRSFKGKPVFIDLWASWCYPCKDEFKFSSALYAELNKRNIEMLYVSIDKDPGDSTWNADIKAFNLRGNHIKATKVLRDELTTLIWHGIDAFSIPHYLMFDGNGKLLSIDMLMPSDTTKLYAQIDEMLSQRAK